MTDFDSTDHLINNMSPNWGIMLTMQENLNMRIGVRRRKKYISAAFWNYISTPINFIITLFTAVSASQTGATNRFLSNNQVFYVLVTTFILSTINTFFKLKEKAQMNYDIAKIYEEFGRQFEDIYFTPIMEPKHVGEKLQRYNQLHKDIMTYSCNEKIDSVNYITDCIFFCWSRRYHGRLRQIEQNERYWVLDGKPHHGYENNYPILMDNYFLSNFDTPKQDEGITGKLKGFGRIIGILRKDPVVPPVSDEESGIPGSPSSSKKYRRSSIQMKHVSIDPSNQYIGDDTLSESVLDLSGTCVFELVSPVPTQA